MTILGIPVRCPKCGGNLKAVCYDPFLKILKHRCWWICGGCGFEMDVEKFKAELMSV